MVFSQSAKQKPKQEQEKYYCHQARWNFSKSERKTLSAIGYFRIGIIPMNPQSAYTRLKILLKKAELPLIRFHDLRHSHASLLANEGINIQEIARRLGHSNVQMTWNTYSHLYPREEKRAVEILNRISPK